MFPIAPQILVFAAIAIFVAGIAIGLLSGFVFAWILKLRVVGSWKDGALGAVGVCVGFLAALTIPWPENTVTTPLGNGAVVQSTMNRFQHPFLIAFITAALLPAMRQVFRLVALKRGSPVSGSGAA